MRTKTHSIVDDNDKLFASNISLFNAEQYLTRLLNYGFDVYIVDNDYEDNGKHELYINQ
jgi:hypothetical protein